MNIEKLQSIIAQKNQRLEDQAVRTADELINDILELTDAIAEAQQQIAEKREELKKLEIRTVNTAVVLGE